MLALQVQEWKVK